MGKLKVYEVIICFSVKAGTYDSAVNKALRCMMKRFRRYKKLPLVYPADDQECPMGSDEGVYQ